MTGTSHVALVLPDLRAGGAERVSLNLANALAARGYRVDAVLLEATGPLLEQLDPRIRVVDLKSPRLRRTLIPLTRYLKRERPEATLVCMWPLTTISIIARCLSRSKTRLIVAEHSTWSRAQVAYSPIQRPLIRASMRHLFPHADAVVAVSEAAAADLAVFAGLPDGLVRCIYNPVVPTGQSERSAMDTMGLETWARAQYRLLTVGSLKRPKNHELLIRAFARLCRSTPAQLLILGEGSLRGKLQQLAAELGVAERVCMPGFRDDPAPYYEHASLFVLSSDWEGLPTVLIEALAAGTPVVSTDCLSGPDEILCHGRFGTLVPCQDEQALANAMENALGAKPQVEALKRRAGDFSIERAVDAYEHALFPLGATARKTSGVMTSNPRTQHP